MPGILYRDLSLFRPPFNQSCFEAQGYQLHPPTVSLRLQSNLNPFIAFHSGMNCSDDIPRASRGKSFQSHLTSLVEIVFFIVLLGCQHSEASCIAGSFLRQPEGSRATGGRKPHVQKRTCF